MSDVGLPGATARLRVDASGVRSGVSQANSAFSQLEKVVATNWWGLKNLGLAFAALPAAVATGVFAAVKASSAYEDALVGVARTTNEAGVSAEKNSENLKVLEGELAKIAQSRPIATVEILGIAESAGALGVAQEDVARFTAVVADLSATTDLTADAAATALARIAGLTGLTGAQYDNLASSILEAGRTTAATESDIVNIAKRLAGVAGVVGLTADEVIGIAATVKSVGVNTEAGGTAIQSTFFDISQAVEENGKELGLWAKITNQSTTDFAAGFSDDAAGQFLKIVQGLGGLSEKGIKADGVLAQLGITEKRQVNALLLLAKGEAQAGNEGFKLSKNLDVTNKAFAAATASAEAAEKKNKTLSAQIQILKNNLFALGKMLGDNILPILKPIVTQLGNFITGVRALPGPIKGLLSVVVGIITVLSGLAAVVLIVGSRIVLAIGAFGRLGATAASAVPGLAGNTAALNANAAAAGRAAGAQLAASRATGAGVATSVVGSSANLNKFNNSARTSTTALSAQASAALASEKASSLAGGAAAKAAPKFGKLGGKVGIAAIIIAAAAGAITFFGSKIKKQEDAAKDATSANIKLTARIKDQAKGVGPAADGWVRTQLAQNGAADTAAKLGIAQELLLKIIQGTASQAELNSFYDALKNGQANAIPGTKELASNVNNLMKEFGASAAEAGVVARANGNLTGTDEELAAAFAATTEDAKKKRDALLDQVSATLDYIDATFSARSAANAVADAQVAYRDALRATGENAEKVADAHRNLEDAYRGVEDAQRAVVDASRAIVDADKDIVRSQEAIVDAQKEVIDKQKELDESRAKGLREQQDAEDDLADAQDSYLNSLDDIGEKEKDLAELRAGPELKDLADAIDKLRDANINLVKSQRKVKDAEFQLQYLREEGASNRDIEDAELALVEARDEVIDASDDLRDSEEELADLRDNSDLVKEIEKAERDLANARRDSQAALRDIGDKEKEVNDIRAKIAADGYYKDALDEYTDAVRAQTDAYDAYDDAILGAEDAQRGYADAQRGVRDALREVTDAERELANVRREIASDTSVRDAALAVEKSIYDLAKLRVEERKALALSKPGGTFDAGDEAAAMAEELEKLVAQAPTAEIAKRLRDYIALLRKVPKTPKADGGTPGGKEKEVELPDAAKDGFQLPDDFIKPPKKSLKDQILKILGDGVTGATIGGTIGSLFGPLGTLIGATLGFAIEAGLKNLGLAGTIKAALLGTGGLLVFTEEGRKIAGNFIGGFFDGLTGGGDEGIGAKIGRFFNGIIRDIKKLFGINSPSTVMIGIGADVILGFIEGIGGGMLGVLLKAAELPGKVLEGIGDILTPVKEKGKEAIKGFLEGVDEKFPGVKTFFEELPGKVRDFIGDIFGGNKKKGEESVDGIKQGAQDREPGLLGFFRDLPGRVRDNVGNIFETVKGKGHDIIDGIRRGIDDRFPNLFETLGSVYRAITGFFSNPFDILFDTGRYIFGGLYNGLVDFYNNTIVPFLNDVHNAFSQLLGPPKDDKTLLVGTGRLIMGGLQAGLAQGWLGVRDQLNGYHQEMANFTFEPGLADAVRGASSTASGTTLGAAAGVTNNWNFNLEANTNANPQELIGEFLFASRVRTR